MLSIFCHFQLNDVKWTKFGEATPKTSPQYITARNLEPDTPYLIKYVAEYSQKIEYRGNTHSFKPSFENIRTFQTKGLH